MALGLNGSSGITFPDSSNQASGRQSVKAWMHLNGTGTPTIQSSYGVSSVTDVAVGRWDMNFTEAMPDASYCVAASSSETATGVQGSQEGHIKVNDYFTTKVHLVTHFHVFNVSSRIHDSVHVCAAVFR